MNGYNFSYSNIFTDNILYTDKISLENSVTIFPNPAEDIISLNSSKQKIQSVEIYNIMGELIYSSTNKSTGQIDISGFRGGVYFLHIKTADGIVMKKIVKE